MLNYYCDNGTFQPGCVIFSKFYIKEHIIQLVTPQINVFWVRLIDSTRCCYNIISLFFLKKRSRANKEAFIFQISPYLKCQPAKQLIVQLLQNKGTHTKLCVVSYFTRNIVVKSYEEKLLLASVTVHMILIPIN